eukprot:SAG31_NODE_3945_length_3729_cov_4.246832_1_plen_181_part_00
MPTAVYQCARFFLFCAELPTVVRSTFEETVLRATGPLAVAVKKPGCDACATLGPVLVRLQTELTKAGIDFPIFEFDGISNSVFDMSGLALYAEKFPTLMVFDKNAPKNKVSDSTVSLSRAPSFDALVSFVGIAAKFSTAVDLNSVCLQHPEDPIAAAGVAGMSVKEGANLETQRAFELAP